MLLKTISNTGRITKSVTASSREPSPSATQTIYVGRPGLDWSLHLTCSAQKPSIQFRRWPQGRGRGSGRQNWAYFYLVHTIRARPQPWQQQAITIPIPPTARSRGRCKQVTVPGRPPARLLCSWARLDCGVLRERGRFYCWSAHSAC